MLRSVLARASVAGAAAAAPSQAHAWSQPPSSSGQHGPVRQIVKADGTTLAKLSDDAPSREEIVQDWLLADITGDEPLFNTEEVDAAVSGLIALAPSLPDRLRGGSEADTDGHYDADSDALSAQDHMETAGRNMALAHSNSFFQTTLSSMLQNRKVQQACLEALREDPSFAQLLHSSPLLPSTSDVMVTEESEPVLERGPRGVHAAPQGSQHQHSDPLLAFIGRALNKMEAKLAPAWDAVERFFIKAGYLIHQALGRPFKKESAKAASGGGHEDMQAFSKAWWGEVLITVGCAVIVLLIMRRVGMLAGVAAGGAAYTAASAARQGPANPQGTGTKHEAAQNKDDDTWAPSA